MKSGEAIFELSKHSSEIEKIWKRLEAFEVRVKRLEAGAASLEGLEVLQRWLNELAELLCDLMQQVDALREQLGHALDKVSDLWGCVRRCRC
jgi:predicted nuclease with TOPRIM domain